MAKDWFIQTYSGKLVTLRNIRPSQIDMNDIAHGLSMKCRFSGQISKFYSVAEHSVNVATLLSDFPYSLQLAGLLHDAHEFITPDVPTPIKNFMNKTNAIFKIQEDIDVIIAERYKLKKLLRAREVKTADLMMLYHEKRILFPNQVNWGLENTVPTPARDIPIFGHSPSSAEKLFLDRFEFLWRMRQNEIAR